MLMQDDLVRRTMEWFVYDYCSIIKAINFKFGTLIVLKSGFILSLILSSQSFGHSKVTIFILTFLKHGYTASVNLVT